MIFTAHILTTEGAITKFENLDNMEEVNDYAFKYEGYCGRLIITAIKVCGKKCVSTYVWGQIGWDKLTSEVIEA